MRLVRRVGGVLGSAVRGGIALAGLRRPAVQQPSLPCQAARGASDPPKPRRVCIRRRSRAAASVPPGRPGWLARTVGLARRRPVADSPAWFPDSGDAPFTPETCPGLSPESCAIFNTPLEDCDPNMLCAVFSVLAELIVERRPAEAGGRQDVEAVLANLWDRLKIATGEARPGGLPDAAPVTQPDAALAAAADPAPAVPTGAMVGTPMVSPDPLSEIPLATSADIALAASADMAPATPADMAAATPTDMTLATSTDVAPATSTDIALAPTVSPGLLHDPHAASLPCAAAIAKPEAASETVSRSRPVRHRDRAPVHGSRSVHRRRAWLEHCGRQLCRRCRDLIRRRWCNALQTLPARRLCYAACAGLP